MELPVDFAQRLAEVHLIHDVLIVPLVIHVVGFFPGVGVAVGRDGIVEISIPAYLVGGIGFKGAAAVFDFAFRCEQQGKAVAFQGLHGSVMRFPHGIVLIGDDEEISAKEQQCAQQNRQQRQLDHQMQEEYTLFPAREFFF